MITPMSVAEELFTPHSDPLVGRIGLEIELHPVTVGSRPRPADPAVLRRAFAVDPSFLRAASVSFEPGGQVELSLPPAGSVTEAFARAEAAVVRAQALADRAGVVLVASGTNPWHTCDDIPLRSPSPRYVAMGEMLGPAGPQMMRLTASLQISVDLLPGPAGPEQWLVANLAAPVLAAAFANSPNLDGRPAGIPGARTAVWHRIDRRRSGYDGRHLDVVDPVGAYARFLAGAPRFPIPDAADDRYHATTVFPPVRPRGGYLEIRALDSLPVPRLGEAVRTVATLLYDDRARRDALDLLLPTLDGYEGAWERAAAGVSPVAADLLALAGQAAGSAA
jgi:glutamate--cysteine ligase